jgi:hypothetical protein
MRMRGGSAGEILGKSGRDGGDQAAARQESGDRAFTGRHCDPIWRSRPLAGGAGCTFEDIPPDGPGREGLLDGWPRRAPRLTDLEEGGGGGRARRGGGAGKDRDTEEVQAVAGLRTW